MNAQQITSSDLTDDWALLVTFPGFNPIEIPLAASRDEVVALVGAMTGGFTVAAVAPDSRPVVGRSPDRSPGRFALTKAFAVGVAVGMVAGAASTANRAQAHIEIPNPALVAPADGPAAGGKVPPSAFCRQSGSRVVLALKSAPAASYQPDPKDEQDECLSWLPSPTKTPETV